MDGEEFSCDVLDGVVLNGRHGPLCTAVSMVGTK